MELNLFIWIGLIPFFINLVCIMHKVHKAPSWYESRLGFYKLAEKYGFDFSDYQCAKRYFWQSVYFCVLYLAYAVLYNCDFSYDFMNSRAAGFIFFASAAPLCFLDILDIMTSSHAKAQENFDKLVDSTLNAHFGYSVISLYPKSVIEEDDYPEFLKLRKACREYRTYSITHTVINTISALIIIAALKS